MNQELERAFYATAPTTISRKVLQEVKPILDEIATISRNLDLEIYFTENASILQWMNLNGTLNSRKVKATAEELQIDISTPAGLKSAEDQVRAEVMASFPGLVKAFRSYRMEIDPNDDKSWALAIDLIRKTAVIANDVDKTLIESNDDPAGEFWSNQDVQEVQNYVQHFRQFMPK